MFGLVAVLVMFCITGSVGFAAGQSGKGKHGLLVNNGGILIKDGTPYRGIGVNFYNAFTRALVNPNDSSYREGFEVLGEYGIPFARISIGGYWPNPEWNLYLEDKERYYQILDDVVQSAEQNNVGLIPSFFWTVFSVPDVIGEPVNSWGDTSSNVHEFLRTYVQEVVTRYKDSPAIWGWEFGNEYNLPADLPNASDWRPPVIPELGTAPSRSEDDELTHEMIRIAFTQFAEEERKYDQDRIIISGNSIPRPSEWHQEQFLTWDQDSEEQFSEMLNNDNPDPMNTISVHLYDLEERRFSRTISVEELLKKLKHISKKAKKPLFVGEFGVSENLGHEAAKQNFERFVTAIDKERVPLSAVWVFDLANQPENTITATNDRAYQLERIQEMNESYSRERK